MASEAIGTVDDVQLTRFRPSDERRLREIIAAVGWNPRQIEAQLRSVARLAVDGDGCVVVARRGDEILGFASAEFHEWNRLGQIHGLVVEPASRRRRVASRLVERLEVFLRAKGARGVYVDTPVDNAAGRRFYEAAGFGEAYTMPEYYDVGQDGVTYTKFFR